MPVISEPTAARATTLTDALYFRHEQRRRHRGFHLRILPAFAPRPHQPLRHHARSLERARSHVRLDSFFFLRARRLRHRRTLSVAVESPRVIRAQQRPVALHPSLAQRRQPVRTLILEHAPRPITIFPNHQIYPEQRRRVRFRLVQHVHHRHRVPLLRPRVRVGVGVHHGGAIGVQPDRIERRGGRFDDVRRRARARRRARRRGVET